MRFPRKPMAEAARGRPGVAASAQGADATSGNDVRGVVGVGAGGHAVALVEILQGDPTYELVGLTDIRADLWGTKVLGLPVLGGDEVLPELRRKGVAWAFVGVGTTGDAGPRQAIFRKLRDLGFRLVTAIHRTAWVPASTFVGEGATILAGAVLGPCVRLGENVIVYSGAIVEHHSILGDHVQVGPGARLGGSVVVGERAFIGIGASVKHGVRIGPGAIVGAGAVVVNDVPDNVVVVGVPARLLKRVEE